MTWSALNPVVGIKPGDSGVMIGYQIDEFTFTVDRVFCWSITHLLLCKVVLISYAYLSQLSRGSVSHIFCIICTVVHNCSSLGFLVHN